MIKRLTTFLFLAILFSNSLWAEEANVRVRMSTEMGDIVIDLFADKAPVTVENFLRHVDGEYFDNSEFYRVVTFENDNGSPAIEVIQGGLNERESPFPPIAHETTEQTGILHADGMISMARGGVGTATTEFFICVGDQPGLDFGQPRNEDGQGFAAFGQVISGMNVVRQINTISAETASADAYTAGQILEQPIKIISVRRI